MTESRTEARFIDGARGRLLVVAHQPELPVAGTVLAVPPFAEEMNKSRPLLAALGREAAKRGVRIVIPDLFGTGDSEGEFGAADWDNWKADVARTAAWCAGQGWAVHALIGVRLGCALAIETARDSLQGASRAIFWQPALDGRRYLTQFLRMRVAASMMESRSETVEGLRRRLAQGETLEIAGYAISSQLAEQIDRIAGFDLAGTGIRELHWLEVTREQRELSGQSRNAIERLRTQIESLQVHLVPGEPFWTTTEIVRLPELVSRSAGLLVH